MIVTRTTSDKDGGCNGCYRDGKHDVFKIRLEGQSFRLCDSCSMELVHRLTFYPENYMKKKEI